MVEGKCCPYYLYEEPLFLLCEGGKVRFADFQHRRDYVYTYCSSANGCKKCTIFKAITKADKRIEKKQLKDASCEQH